MSRGSRSSSRVQRRYLILLLSGASERNDRVLQLDRILAGCRCCCSILAGIATFPRWATSHSSEYGAFSGLRSDSVTKLTYAHALACIIQYNVSRAVYAHDSEH